VNVLGVCARARYLSRMCVYVQYMPSFGVHTFPLHAYEHSQEEILKHLHSMGKIEGLQREATGVSLRSSESTFGARTLHSSSSDPILLHLQVRDVVIRSDSVQLVVPSLDAEASQYQDVHQTILRVPSLSLVRVRAGMYFKPDRCPLKSRW
jgi:hypothetical protein